MTANPTSWESWAPPLAPPTAGGLPRGEAQAIADACWDDEPHLAAAEMWEAWAATLPPTPAVSLVQTGAQSVSYSPAGPVGEYGLAISRATWHRSFLDGLVSVPLRVAQGVGQRAMTAGGPALPDPDPPHAVDAEVTWPGGVWVDGEQLGPRPPHAIDVEELDPVEEHAASCPLRDAHDER